MLTLRYDLDLQVCVSFHFLKVHPTSPPRLHPLWLAWVLLPVYANHVRPTPAPTDEEDLPKCIKNPYLPLQTAQIHTNDCFLPQWNASTCSSFHTKAEARVPRQSACVSVWVCVCAADAQSGLEPWMLREVEKCLNKCTRGCGRVHMCSVSGALQPRGLSGSVYLFTLSGSSNACLAPSSSPFEMCAPSFINVPEDLAACWGIISIVYAKHVAILLISMSIKCSHSKGSMDGQVMRKNICLSFWFFSYRKCKIQWYKTRISQETLKYEKYFMVASEIWISTS